MDIYDVAIGGKEVSIPLHDRLPKPGLKMSDAMEQFHPSKVVLSSLILFSIDLQYGFQCSIIGSNINGIGQMRQSDGYVGIICVGSVQRKGIRASSKYILIYSIIVYRWRRHDTGVEVTHKPHYSLYLRFCKC